MAAASLIRERRIIHGYVSAQVASCLDAGTCHGRLYARQIAQRGEFAVNGGRVNARVVMISVIHGAVLGSSSHSGTVRAEGLTPVNMRGLNSSPIFTQVNGEKRARSRPNGSKRTKLFGAPYEMM